MKKGQKVRTYVLHPQERVVDHRTGLVVHDARAVLDGDLDPFIEANLLRGIEAPPIKRNLR